MNPRAFSFPIFSYRPGSIRKNLRFGSPMQVFDSIVTLAMWFFALALGYSLYVPLYILRIGVWAIKRIGEVLFSITVFDFIKFCFGLMILLILIKM